MKKSVLFQPIGRQPPKDTANQQQGRHARLFSYPATRDARIKFWDFGRTGIGPTHYQSNFQMEPAIDHSYNVQHLFYNI